MSSRQRSKALVALGTLSLCSAIGYINVYIPFYSDAAKQRQTTGSGSVPDGAAVGLSKELNRGSVWTNLGKGIEGAKKGSQTSSEEKK
jgi:hypothetical protein